MILFIGKKYYEFFDSMCDTTSDIKPADAKKIIVTDDSEEAVDAICLAKEKNIPVLAVMNGYKAFVKAFGGEIKEIECKTGNAEWAVIDATSPIYVHLESVIQVSRGKEFAIVEAGMPSDLDCMSRSETGDIIALRNWEEPKKYGNMYAVNYDLESDKTPDGVQIVRNFLNL